MNLPPCLTLASPTPSERQVRGEQPKMHSGVRRGFARLFLRESSGGRFFKLLVFFTWLCSMANVGQSVPNGLKQFSESRGPDGLVRWEHEPRRVERHGRSHHLNRRVASAMVPVRERETTSLCAYEVTTDVNLQRIPDKIDRVVCLKDSCKCVEQGNYRCTQLYTQLNVTYLTPDWKLNFDFELIDVEYACVCSRALEGSSVNLLEPVLV